MEQRQHRQVAVQHIEAEADNSGDRVVVLAVGTERGVAAGINALGKEAALEGKKARAFPLRFVDGAVFLGPLNVAQTPPLF